MVPGTLFYQCSDAFVALSTRADWPRHRLVASDFIRKVRADGREMLRKNECRATSIGSESHVDGHIRQSDARVILGDSRIVPFHHLAQKNSGVSLPGQIESRQLQADYRQ